MITNTILLLCILCFSKALNLSTGNSVDIGENVVFQGKDLASTLDSLSKSCLPIEILSWSTTLSTVKLDLTNLHYLDNPEAVVFKIRRITRAQWDSHTFTAGEINANVTDISFSSAGFDVNINTCIGRVCCGSYVYSMKDNYLYTPSDSAYAYTSLDFKSDSTFETLVIPTTFTHNLSLGLGVTGQLYAMMIKFLSSTQVEYYVSDSPKSCAISSLITFTAGDPYHMAITMGTEPVFYINGIEVCRVGTVAAIADQAGQRLFLGAYGQNSVNKQNNTPWESKTGLKYKYVRVYDRILSQAEIQASYSAGEVSNPEASKEILFFNGDDTGITHVGTTMKED